MSAVRDALIVSKKIENLTKRQIKNVEIAIRVSQAAVSNEAKRLVPVRTGFLQSSIQPGQVKVGFTFITGEVNANANYAEFVEFGTSSQRPQPFMAPAILNEISRYRQRVANAVRL